MVNLYHILQIEAGADANAVKKAFRQLAKKYHPDVNNSANANERFNEIYMAYEILGDEQKKKLYDNLLGSHNEPEIAVDDYYEERVGEWRRTAYRAAQGYGNMTYADFRREKIRLHLWSKYLFFEWGVTAIVLFVLFIAISVVWNALPYEGAKREILAKERMIGFGGTMALVCCFILGNFIRIQVNNFLIRK